MTDYVYNIKNWWRGRNQIIEQASSCYLKDGEVHSKDKEEDAITRLQPYFAGVFGDQTDAIFKDRKAVRDFDLDGYIDIDLRHVYENYFGSDKTKAGSFSNFKKDVLSFMNTGIFGEYFTEHFFDYDTYPIKREVYNPFPFNRLDIKAAVKHFNSKYGGKQNLSSADVDKLRGELQQYLTLVVKNPDENVNDSISFDPEKGFAKFSKLRNGLVRMDCKLIAELAEYILKNILSSDQTSYFEFRYVEGVYQENINTHTMLWAKLKTVAFDKKHKENSYGFGISNNNVIKYIGRLGDEIDYNWVANSMVDSSSELLEGKTCGLIPSKDGKYACHFSLTEEALSYKLAYLKDRLKLGIPHDQISGLLKYFEEATGVKFEVNPPEKPKTTPFDRELDKIKQVVEEEGAEKAQKLIDKFLLKLRRKYLVTIDPKKLFLTSKHPFDSERYSSYVFALAAILYENGDKYLGQKYFVLAEEFDRNLTLAIKNYLGIKTPTPPWNEDDYACYSNNTFERCTPNFLFSLSMVYPAFRLDQYYAIVPYIKLLSSYNLPQEFVDEFYSSLGKNLFTTTSGEKFIFEKDMLSASITFASPILASYLINKYKDAVQTGEMSNAVEVIPVLLARMAVDKQIFTEDMAKFFASIFMDTFSSKGALTAYRILSEGKPRNEPQDAKKTDQHDKKEPQKS